MLIAQVASTFIAAMLELWAALPIGFAVGLSPVWVGIIVSLGAVSGVVVAVLLGERVKGFILKKRGKSIEPGGKLYAFFNKYGAIGYGILAPALVGAFVGSVLGVALGIERPKLILWLSIGAVIWSVIGTALCALGLIAITGH